MDFTTKMKKEDLKLWKTQCPFKNLNPDSGIKQLQREQPL